jgi:hypothetical protein
MSIDLTPLLAPRAKELILKVSVILVCELLTVEHKPAKGNENKGTEP